MSRNGKTRVVHCRKEKYDVYVARGSKWGNPYSHLPTSNAPFKVATREEAIEKYREWILTQPELLADLKSLKGKILSCWCHPLSCHADILAEMADKLEEENENQKSA